MVPKIYIHLLSLTLILIFTSSSKAQSWLPDGRTWVYNWSWWGSGGYEEIAVKPGVTVVNGLSCKALSRHWHYAYYQFTTDSYEIIDEYPEDILACESGDSLWLEKYNGELELQYDFSMQPGDSLIYSEGADARFTLILDSVGSVTLQNQVLQTQFFTGHPLTPNYGMNLSSDQFKVIEKIGMVESPDGIAGPSYLFPSMALRGYADDYYWSLRCALNGDAEYKLMDDCYELVLDTKDNLKSDLVDVFPNPVHGFIHIVVKNSTVLQYARIYDLQGHLVLETVQTDTDIPVSDLVQGAYLLLLQTNEGVLRHRFVKL